MMENSTQEPTIILFRIMLEFALQLKRNDNSVLEFFFQLFLHLELNQNLGLLHYNSVYVYVNVFILYFNR